MTKQSSKNNVCAIRRTSIIYYLCSIIYALKKTQGAKAPCANSDLISTEIIFHFGCLRVNSHHAP